jgi:hypothetical protein
VHKTGTGAQGAGLDFLFVGEIVLTAKPGWVESRGIRAWRKAQVQSTLTILHVDLNEAAAIGLRISRRGLLI